MAVGGDASSLDIKDLNSVLSELEQGQFSEVKWEDFGLKAGLYKNTLQKIKADNKENTHQCFVECLTCWLRREDDVDKQGKPSWRRLAEILEKTGEQALANIIRGRKLRKDLSSNVHEGQQVCTVTTPGRSIFLARPLQDKYDAMLEEFGDILSSFVDWAVKERERLDKLKIQMICYWPSNKKEIDEINVNDAGGLMFIIRSHCSSWNFKILTTLTKRMEMTDITEKLKKFKEKQGEVYKEILAKDFAKSDIEYCGTTASKEVTFEVTWPVDETTLDDFKDFLKDAFSSQGYYMYIHLKTVHNSLLTFVCIIPHWLVDEMKDYVMKNEDLFISKGVVEITVDGTIVFSVSLHQDLQVAHQNKVSLQEALTEANKQGNDLKLSENKGVEVNTQQQTMASSFSSAPFINVCNKELSIDDFPDIYEKIEELSANWKQIAISLRLKINTINKIEVDCRGNSVTCLQKVLECWLRKDYDYERHGIPCWRRVCVAVKEGGGDPALADEIAREHPLPAMPPAGSTSSKGVTPETDEVAMLPVSTNRATGNYGQLASKLHDLQEEFDEAIRITKNSFKSSDLPKIIDYLITHTMSLLGPNKKQQTTAEAVREEFERIETIPKLFTVLQDKYISWFNYKLIIKLVGVFLPKNRSLKRTWSAYEEKLKDYFINSGGLLRDADAVQFGVKGVPPGTRVMIAKVDRDDYTLDDLFFFRRAIPKGLDIPEYDLHFRSVHPS